MIKNKNIIITGGLGFVGSALAMSLSKNNKVYVIDNLFTGRKKNITNKSIKLIISKSENINRIKCLKNKHFQYFFHLGEYSRVEQSYNDIEKVIEFNTRPFYEIIKFCKKNNTKLIYSGSSTKFANYFEDNEIDISPYAWSKISNINLLKLYGKWFGIKYAVTYFYNVYGDNEISTGKYATVIGKFLKYKKQNKILPITKPGTQRRNFTHIDDIISGLVIVAIKGDGDGYGIGSSKSYSIIELANILKMKYKMMPQKKGNRLSGKLKTKKTKELGWSCKNNLNNYLKLKSFD